MQNNTNLWFEKLTTNQYLIWTIVFKNWSKKKVNFELDPGFDFSDTSVLNLLKSTWIMPEDISFENTSLIPSNSKVEQSYDDLVVSIDNTKKAVRNITLH